MFLQMNLYMKTSISLLLKLIQINNRLKKVCFIQIVMTVFSIKMFLQKNAFEGP